MSLFGKKPELEQMTREIGSSGRGYGIAETILLMRSLPVEQNVELVVSVIRNTLESMHVRLADIIEDAAQKEKTIQHRIEALRTETAEFAKQIELRRQEVERLETELAETTTVKERLLLAQNTPLAQAPNVAPPALPSRDGVAMPKVPPPPPPPSPRSQAPEPAQD